MGNIMAVSGHNILLVEPFSKSTLSCLVLFKYHNQVRFVFEPTSNNLIGNKITTTPHHSILHGIDLCMKNILKMGFLRELLKVDFSF
uniref:Putative ovule protein n=1 Tax=Solanum chacoense TaxID=4108 RepID=A0A0V0GMI9_SOLCH